MSEKNDTVSVPKEVLELLRSLPSVHFAGVMHPDLGRLAVECSCQNCGCDSRAGGSCGCNERCSCQGHTASHLDWALGVLLGAAANVPLDDVRGLVELRDRIKAARSK